MKVSKLKGSDLDYWTARADGIDEELINVRALRNGDKVVEALSDEGDWRARTYSNDWRLTGPLIEKFNLDLFNGKNKPDDKMWHAYDGVEVYADGDSPTEAICRAAVQSAFGYEVNECE